MKLFRILMLAFFAISLIACGGAEERKAVYLEKAKVSIEAGDLDKARIELKNVLQIDPKDSDAYFQLGKIYEHQKNYRKAFGNYLKAEELNPDNLANQARLGMIYLQLANEPEKAQSKIDFILSKDPNNSDGLLLKAAMMLKNKDMPEAINISEAVVNGDPDNVESVMFLATLYMRDNRNLDAIKILDNALKVKQNNENLNKLLVYILMKNKDYDRAEVIYKSFLERNPDNSSSYNNLAAFYHQIDDKAKAEEILRASIENDSADIERQLRLVKYIKMTKGNDEAIRELRGLIASNKGLGKLRIALAELLSLSGSKQLAINVYEKAIEDFPDEVTGIDARIALATMYLKDDDFVKASDVVEEAILVSPDNPKVNLIRARIAVHNKDVEKAILSLRIVTKETPENIDAFLLLVSAYQVKNNAEQVRSTLNSAYENNKMNADALMKLARYHLSLDVNQAEKIIDDYNNLKESDYDGLSIKVAILNQKKELLEAHKIAEKMIDLFPDKANGYLQAIPYYVQQRNMQEAISVLEKGYINAKHNRKILILLTTIQGSDKQFDIVEKRIKAELNAAPGDDELKVLLYKVYMAKNDSASAETILNDLVNNKTNLKDPYLWLAQSYINKKDMVAAKSTLLEGISNVVDNVKIALSLASLYEADKEYSQAIDVYRDLYRSHPDNLIIINNLASMLSDHGEKKDDLELAKILVDKLKASKQPVFLDTIGWVYYRLGDYENAIKYLSQAVEKLPKVNVFKYHLGMAYKLSGDGDKARMYLEKSLADNKNFIEKSLAENALKGL